MSVGYLAVSILQMIVYIIYIKEMLGLKRSLKWIPLCVIIAETINYVNETYINHTTAYSLTYLAVLFLISTFLAKGRLLRKLIITITFVVLTIFVELLLIGIVLFTRTFSMEDIQTSEILSTILLLIEQMFIFVGIQFAVLLQKRKYEYDAKLKNSAWVFLNSLGCFIAMMVVGFTMVKTNNFSVEQIVVLVILVSVNFISYYFYNVSVENNKVRLESEVHRKQVELYSEWYESIKEAKTETSRVRHDMNNHFGAIKGIAESNKLSEKKIEDILEYIDKLSFEVKIKHMSDSGNILIDAILDMKKSYANANHIGFIFDVVVPENMKYNEPDFVIVFGNLIDNAIEACKRNGGNVENKISIKLKYDRGNMFMQLKNTYDGSLDGKSGEISDNLVIETSKRDKDNHGMGLSNVARIIGKYQGDLMWEAKSRVFTVNVLMYGFVDI